YEKRKITIDLFKHLATLSVACIAVIVTFLPQLKTLTQAKTLLLVSVICFLLSVICTVFSTIITLANIEDLPKIHGSGLHSFHRLCSLIIILGFLIGVGSLCWLIISNLA
ncbi:hypothetical protein ACFL7M_18590, partial [Thermodesulfobacteriota bacterium]